jgi:hypothetical protein
LYFLAHLFEFVNSDFVPGQGLLQVRSNGRHRVSKLDFPEPLGKADHEQVAPALLHHSHLLFMAARQHQKIQNGWLISKHQRSKQQSSSRPVHEPFVTILGEILVPLDKV